MEATYIETLTLYERIELYLEEKARQEGVESSWQESNGTSATS